MRIDAHQHYWKLDRGEYGWISPDDTVLYRDYLPEHLREHLLRNQIDGTIVVQAAATIAETKYLLQLAEDNDTILGVVGWLDLQDRDYLQHLREMQSHPKFAGVRIMIQEMDDSDEVLQPNMLEAIRTLAELDVPIDLLFRSNQLSSVLALLRHIPDLHAVVDHIGKPPIAQQAFEPWAQQMKEIAKNPRIFCKLSGMVTEADHKAWKTEHFVPYIRFIIELFGVDRVMYGSDWPVCLLAASYEQVIDVLESALPADWTDADKHKLFGTNALKFYRIDIADDNQ